MSHYLHHIIEVKNNNKWETFSVLAKPDEYEEKTYPERIVMINDDKFYKKSEFVTNYLALRDNYFGSYPWKKENEFKYGVPDDADEFTKALTKEYVDGHFHMYNCTIEDLTKEANKVFKEHEEKKHKEDIMEFSTDFVKRLGFGSKDPAENMFDEENVVKEELEDLEFTYAQLMSLTASVSDLVEFVTGDYHREDSVRIIIWTD